MPELRARVSGHGCVCLCVCECMCVGLEFKLGSLKVVGMCWGVTVVCELGMGVAVYWGRRLVGAMCVCVCRWV